MAAPMPPKANSSAIPASNLVAAPVKAGKVGDVEAEKPVPLTEAVGMPEGAVREGMAGVGALLEWTAAVASTTTELPIV